ncbi:2,3-bisphosphoglycerate-independent phosphoglycerate mutase [Candidatus Woesearchaeota archaeon]|nr:2,3-bisphosphoglycerate-independent phosphoglycerate mutase [Candidatus Woesearchaeota archaeon]
MERKNKLLLVILDGFGHNPKTERNAVKQAKMPYYNSLQGRYPHTLLNASSEHVGLPKNTMGNSEVGHLNIGAGRIVNQHCLRINKSITDKSFYKNKTLKWLFSEAKKRGKNAHVVGLLSSAGVHSHINHLKAIIKFAGDSKTKTHLHLFTDGRDMEPHSSEGLIRAVNKAIKSRKISIATISGRYYGMDRDNRWNRTKKAYDAIVYGKGLHAKSATEAIKNAYNRKESDEFIKPTIIDGYPGIGDGDYIFSFNFRADRARQLCWAFTKKGFTKFRCTSKKATLATMTLHDPKRLLCPTAFPEKKLKNTMAETLSRQKIRQLHIAETEKYAHVTYFFNGGREKPFPMEKRILVPSPKISTYDKKPEMSAYEITKAAVKEIKKGKYGFILINYANPDMVGHTGNLEATKKALNHADKCLRKIIKEAVNNGYIPAITSDHGNCEDMTEGMSTSHTKNKVQLIIITNKKHKLAKGSLCDVAPTLLKLAHIRTPKEMKGKNLIR